MKQRLGLLSWRLQHGCLGSGSGGSLPISPLASQLSELLWKRDHCGGLVQQHSWCLQLIAVWPSPQRSTERFQNLVLKLTETCRTSGRPAFHSLLLFPAVERPLGGQPPSKERKGHRKVFSLPFFSPLPLGGFWSNSAVSSLGELHVYCTFCTRNACSDHRVPLNYVFFF